MFGPVIPAIFRIGDIRLSLFATIAQFGTPEDLLLDDLEIGFYCRAEEKSTQLLNVMAG